MARLYATLADINTFYQDLMQRRWKVVSVDLSAGDEMKQGDILQFTPDMKVERTDTWKSGDWAVSCYVAPDGLRGATLDNRPFLIQPDSSAPSTQLVCIFQDSLAQTMLRTVALGTAAGAMAGVVAGAFAGSWVAGALTGVAAGLAGSLVVAARAGQGANGVTTASTATLAVDDGKSGAREIDSGTAQTLTA